MHCDVQQRTLLGRVLRRVLETAFEKALRRGLRRCLAMGFNSEKGSEKVVSKKGLSTRHIEGRNITWPALHKTFVGFFFKFSWEFCIEKRRGFSVIFYQVSIFPRHEAWKPLQKFGENSEQIRGKIRDENSMQNSGRKFDEFGELSFCNSCDLKLETF